MNAEIAVVTVTWARDAAEEALLLRSMEALVAHRYPVVAADRTGTPAFTAALQRLGVQLAPPDAPGLVAQVQAAMAAAAVLETPFVLYTEPDKEVLFRERLSRFLARAPRTPDTGVVLAARNASSFATFPPMQRYVEDVVNTLCGRLTGVAGDYSYGPFLLNRALIPHIAGLATDLGWGWRISTFLAAHRSERRVVHLEDELACPPDQRGETDEDRLHRIRQLSQNVRGMVVT